MSLRSRIETGHWNREQPASALRVDLGMVPDYRGGDGWVYMEGREPWSMVDHARAFQGLAPCPVCNDAPLKRTRYCAGCDRTGLDGRVAFPGEPVNSRPNPDYPPEPTVLKARAKGLKGGLGDRVGKRRKGRERVALAKGA